LGFAFIAIIGILPAGMSVQKDNREETIVNLDSDSCSGHPPLEPP